MSLVPIKKPNMWALKFNGLISAVLSPNNLFAINALYEKCKRNSTYIKKNNPLHIAAQLQPFW